MRVVVADDSMLVREGLARLLAEAGCEVVGTAENGTELLRAVELAEPDVAIVDIRMPPTNTDEGIAAAMEIRRAHPTCRGAGALSVPRVRVRHAPARRGA